MSDKRSVLFIDDDKHLIRIVHDFLTHEQFVVHTAASAEEGLHLLQTLTPDIIVLDISMPGMGGIGFLKRISNPDGSLQHPVLVLTARAVMQEFFNTVAVDGFLPKPCSELDLIRHIRDIIAEHDRRKEEEAERNPPPFKYQVVLGEDDNKMWPKYVKMFRECGFKVKLALSGPEVLEAAVSMHPDAVVMKEMLPKLNGSVVARLIKIMPNTNNIPVIVYDTTRSDTPTLESTQAIDVFLFSSLALDLVTAVRKVLDS